MPNNSPAPAAVSHVWFRQGGCADYPLSGALLALERHAPVEVGVDWKAGDDSITGLLFMHNIHFRDACEVLISGCIAGPKVKGEVIDWLYGDTRFPKPFIRVTLAACVYRRFDTHWLQVVEVTLEPQAE